MIKTKRLLRNEKPFLFLKLDFSTIALAPIAVEILFGLLAAQRREIFNEAAAELQKDCSV